MSYQPLPIAATYRRFLALNKKLKRMLASGQFNALSKERQQELLWQVRKLFHRLSRVIPQRRLRQALAVSALLLGLGGSVQAQQFADPVQNPFGLDLGDNERNLFPISQLVDIDGDGDYDLMHRSYIDVEDDFELVLIFQENIGTAQAPAFGELVFNPFGAESLPDGSTTLTFGDLDNDGDYDMLAGQYDSEYFGGTYFTYFENTGTPTAPAFAAPQSDPFGLALEGDVDSTVPYLVDLDNDGDLDLLVGTYSYDTDEVSIYYLPNTGTAQNPAFGASQLNPFGLQPDVDGYLFLPAVADFDNDGDLDIVAGGAYEYLGYDNYLTALDYYENTGTATSPAFAPPQRNAFGLAPQINGYVAIPTAADLDDDGDVDVLTSGYAYEAYGTGFTFEYFENTAITSTIDLPAAENHLQLFPTVTTGVVNWQYESDQRPQQLLMTLYDLTGRPLLQQALQGQAGTLSVSELPAGFYHARLTDGQGQFLGLRRVVKQ
jgi:hypothetical protein